MPVPGYDRAWAAAAVAAVDADCSGHLGLAARHLETGQDLCWNPEVLVGTASVVKVGIQAAVLRAVRLGQLDLGGRVRLRDSDRTGGSGIMDLLGTGLTCTVADLITLMITLSDNTATNMLIELCGGAEAVTAALAELGFGGITLYRPIRMRPKRFDPALLPAPPSDPPATTPPATTPPAADPPAGPLATASPAELCRLMAALHAGTVIDAAASAQIIAVLRHRQSHPLLPLAFTDLAEPDGAAGPDGPAIASKAGWTSGRRVETGLLWLPGGGGTVAYAAAAEGLADQSMTALAEGDQLLGRLGAIVLARWWPGPGSVPVRAGWLPAPDRE